MQYDSRDRRPAWPWFVAFCVVIAALASVYAGVRWKSRQLANTPPKNPPAGETAATPSRGEAAPPATTASTEPAGAARGMPEPLRAQFAEAERATRDAFYQDARARWLALLQEPLPDDARATAEKSLADATLALLTSAAPMPGKTNYTIKPGDAMSKIARRHNMTQEMLMRMNNIGDPSKITAGRVLVVLDKPAFSLRVNRAAGSAALLLDNGLVKRWPAQPGRGDATPAGEFTVGNKAAGHPGNAHGSRWIGLSPLGGTQAVGAIGLHGSNGRDPGGGSVRMADADIEELFWMIPQGTPVTIE
ncbi:MAG: LysM peptidoglycan-binding domain-containing protein [Kiritimatiellaeota bacterium]|nr:LysM peptidoglycan-binding domain-containing protein [Kiritimatiellota bacterium]